MSSAAIKPFINESNLSSLCCCISRRKRHIEEQYKILKSSPSVPSLLPMQQDQGLVTVGKYSITEADLSSLEEDAWLNDNVRYTDIFKALYHVRCFEIIPANLNLIDLPP